VGVKIAAYGLGEPVTVLPELSRETDRATVPAQVDSETGESPQLPFETASTVEAGRDSQQHPSSGRLRPGRRHRVLEFVSLVEDQVTLPVGKHVTGTA
jgi:hypothetical protein